MTSCPAPHVPPPDDNCTPLTWLEADDTTRCRVRAWTCDCDDTVYELCTAGGQTFLKRTHRNNPTAFETHRMNTREGHRTWKALLAGLTR